MYRVKREIKKTGGRFPLARVFRDRESELEIEREGGWDFRVVTMFAHFSSRMDVPLICWWRDFYCFSFSMLTGDKFQQWEIYHKQIRGATIFFLFHRVRHCFHFSDVAMCIPYRQRTSDTDSEFGNLAMLNTFLYKKHLGRCFRIWWRCQIYLQRKS